MKLACGIGQTHMTGRMASIKPDLPAPGFGNKLICVFNGYDIRQITNEKPIIIAGVAGRGDMPVGKAKTLIGSCNHRTIFAMGLSEPPLCLFTFNSTHIDRGAGAGGKRAGISNMIGVIMRHDNTANGPTSQWPIKQGLPLRGGGIALNAAI